jgi:hypothetical protein
MLNRFRKRLGSLLSSATSSEGVLESEKPPETPPEPETPPPPAVPPARPTSDLELAMEARREARRREARLLLSERLHNRSATLLGELRNRLLQAVQQRLDRESGADGLRGLLQLILDPAFTGELDNTIYSQVQALLAKLREEFQGESEGDIPLPLETDLVRELQSYRDQILRTHMLDQIEVFALPLLQEVFPEGKVEPEAMRARLGEYWSGCRGAIDRFFHSVEMALLNGARPGIRLEGALIRERLLAAQFRNGYRILENRLREIYATVIELQMASNDRALTQKSALDRRVVEEIVVPLAFFIRDRPEPEPEAALFARAELFRDLVDKLVASREPYQQTAEAVKPLLRRSIEQVRPLSIERFPYLRPAIESFKASEIHRATALLHLLETLLRPDLDELALEAVEQNVRLNKSQYQLYLQLTRAHRPLVTRFAPLDRIEPADADFLVQFIEETDPSVEALEDMARRLGYLPPAQPSADDLSGLARAIAVLATSRNELSSWRSLYGSTPPTPDELGRLAKIVLRQIRPTGIGADDRQVEHNAVPLPVDLGRTLAAMGYVAADGDRVKSFRAEVSDLVASGKAADLHRALELLRRLQEAVDEERRARGHVANESDPYLVEVWLQESGTLVGLLFYRAPGFGTAPVEKLTRPPAEGEEEKLRRQLGSQAVIYHASHRLFSRPADLSLDQRRALPAYLKTTYERIEPSRHVLLGHLRNTRALARRIDEFVDLIQAVNPSARGDAAAVIQILSGLERKLEQTQKEVESAPANSQVSRLLRELERILKYFNVLLIHSVNPWLERQTRGVATEFEFREEDVLVALRQAAIAHGLDWGKDVRGTVVNPIRGTLGCRALIELAEGVSKVVLLDYDRRLRQWKVKHFGPRLSDVLRSTLRQFNRTLPDDYDEKHEQPILGLEETTCRFLFIKRGVVRVEATLVLEPSAKGEPWKVVFLKWNDEVLIDSGPGSLRR